MDELRSLRLRGGVQLQLLALKGRDSISEDSVENGMVKSWFEPGFRYYLLNPFSVSVGNLRVGGGLPKIFSGGVGLPFLAPKAPF